MFNAHAKDVDESFRIVSSFPALTHKHIHTLLISPTIRLFFISPFPLSLCIKRGKNFLPSLNPDKMFALKSDNLHLTHSIFAVASFECVFFGKPFMRLVQLLKNLLNFNINSNSMKKNGHTEWLQYTFQVLFTNIIFYDGSGREEVEIYDVENAKYKYSCK